MKIKIGFETIQDYLEFIDEELITILENDASDVDFEDQMMCVVLEFKATPDVATLRSIEDTVKIHGGVMSNE